MTATLSPPPETSAASVTIIAARHAQQVWEQAPVRDRLRPIAALRRSIAADPPGWAELIAPPQRRTTAESLAAEVGPLADACAWLDRQAVKTLRPRRSGGRFGSLGLRVERKPLGVVLVIGASNYPLFLLAVPAVQALAAGNAVLLKPAPSTGDLAVRVHETLVAGGLEPALCPVLEGTAEAGQDAINAGVDHVVLTGSAATGRAAARLAADRLTPCTLECSGNDAAIVLPGADSERVVECVAWGLTFNAGATCIGPRRLIVVGDPAPFCEAITKRVATLSADAPPPSVALGDLHDRPDDVFQTRLRVVGTPSVEAAIETANADPYALGASVFGPSDAAAAVATRLRAGCVTVNDLIAPTADPRVPFGGAGESGYGVTRGPEGLLAMTRPQAIVTRRGRWLPHLEPVSPALDELLDGMIQSRHATGLAARWRGVRRFLTAATRHRNQNK